MASDCLGGSGPLCNDFKWLTVFMRHVSARRRDGDGVGMATFSRRPGDGVVIVRMYTFHASVVVIGIVPAIRRVRGFRRLFPGNAMIVVSCRATTCTVSMIRQLIDSEGGKMKVFQILNEQVIIIQGSKVYIDSLDNFKTDSGVDDLPGMVVYDESQKCCVVDSLFYKYPNDTYEGYLSNLQDYLDAKAKREYVPPAEPTVEEKKTSITADYNSGVEELTKSFNIAVLRGDTEAQESIKQDFSDLQEAYKAEMEAVE